MVSPSTSTPQKNTSIKTKGILRHTSPETFLDTFNSKDLTPADLNKMADQVLKRGVQQAAEETLPSREAAVDDNDYIRRSGRATKVPSRYGDPIKHSVKLISSEDDIMDLNKAALEKNRIKMATLNPTRKIQLNRNLAFW